MTKEFKVMLASEYDPTKQKFPALASPKLDGIRCTIQNGVAMSRTGKPIRNKYVQSIIGHHDLNGLDGELMVGDPTAGDAFRQATSGVMSFDGEPDFKYMVFDKYHPTDVFKHRLLEADSTVGQFDNPHVEIVTHYSIETLEELDLLETKWVGEQGYEGVMLRNPHGLYKQARATTKSGDLLKVKRFIDAEFVVVGYAEEMTQHGEPKDSLGKLICTMPNGDIFGVGSGFTRAEREDWWQDPEKLIGMKAKVKYFNVGFKDVPRFPSFLGWRHEEDM